MFACVLLATGVTASAAGPPVLRRLPPVERAPVERNPTGAIRLTSAVSAVGPSEREEVYPIDLANALALGGAGRLQVRLARSRVAEAQSEYLRARAAWLPSLQLIVAYNNHAGRLQETEGNVLEISRSSLFAGGGIGPAGGGPLTAGAGGPPRAFVSWSLADAAFEPLAVRQRVGAARAESVAALNDSLLEIASAYFELVEAYGVLANARLGEQAVGDLVVQLQEYLGSGLGSRGGVRRGEVALAAARRAALDAERLTRVRSAELARLLRLPPAVRLAPADEFALPIDFVGADEPVDALIALAVAARPEVSQHRALEQAACYHVRQEAVRPWLPSLHLGVSGGAFGGGPGTDFPNADGRSDVDLVAIWELENLGAGNVASRRRRRSQLHQRRLEMLDLRDRIAAEVVAAVADVRSLRDQTRVAKKAITTAEDLLRLESERVRQGEGAPVELIDSIGALGAALDEHTHAAAEHNRAQYRLMRALGTTPAASPIDVAPAALDEPPDPLPMAAKRESVVEQAAPGGAEELRLPAAYSR